MFCVYVYTRPSLICQDKKNKKSTSGNKYARIIANTALYHFECTFTELIFCAYSKNTYGCQCYPSAF